MRRLRPLEPFNRRIYIYHTALSLSEDSLLGYDNKHIPQAGERSAPNARDISHSGFQCDRMDDVKLPTVQGPGSIDQCEGRTSLTEGLLCDSGDCLADQSDKIRFMFPTPSSTVQLWVKEGNII